jgi:hypothetical protein
MYNLMYRRFQPSEISAMDYQEMKFWNRGHELIVKADKEAAKCAT